MSFTVCIFCGAYPGNNKNFAAVAGYTGAELAKLGMHVVIGGGDKGLMCAVTDGARAHGGMVTGVFPEVLGDKADIHKDLTALIRTPCMLTRKIREFEISDVFVALPGAIGTMDEILTVLLLNQRLILSDSHKKPIIVFNYNNFWDGYIQQIDHMISNGFLLSERHDLMQVAHNHDELLALIVNIASAKVQA